MPLQKATPKSKAWTMCWFPDITEPYWPITDLLVLVYMLSVMHRYAKSQVLENII